MRLAVWSGPRNLSTALMYSFAARGDVAVWDEPFYSAYLTLTGLKHPMRGEIIAAGEPDPARVINRLVGPVPSGRAIFYQKHMCQHMIEGIDRNWLREVTNVFLVRHPARVLASFAAKRENPEFDELGFRQQFELFEMVAGREHSPVVIDSADIRAAPGPMLRALCATLGIDFSDVMLHWPAGGHPDDGVWAPVWYAAVHRSTGFAGVEPPLPELAGAKAGMVARALPYYEALARFRLQAR